MHSKGMIEIITSTISVKILYTTSERVEQLTVESINISDVVLCIASHEDASRHDRNA